MLAFAVKFPERVMRNEMIESGKLLSLTTLMYLPPTHLAVTPTPTIDTAKIGSAGKGPFGTTMSVGDCETPTE